jgi:predicted adenylyl cyclase CyaB
MGLEVELKFKVDSHTPYIARLVELAAEPGKRVRQRDLYYDNAAGDMLREDKCLRIREYSDEFGGNKHHVLCYKGPRRKANVKIRSEYEIPISDEEALKKILAGIGFSLKISVEKRRSYWRYNNCDVCFDSLPYIGSYIEVEGESEESVEQVCRELGLCWQSEKASYACLIAEAAGLGDAPANVKLPPCDETCESCEEFTEMLRGKTVEIVANVKSGAGNTGKLIEGIAALFKERGYDVRKTSSASFHEILRNVNRAAEDPSCGLIAICGGDGTLRGCIEATCGSGKPLLLVPCGTENLLAKELGYEQTIGCYEKILDCGVLRNIDIAKANGKVFTSVLGIGYDAETVELLSESRQGNITHADYLWPAWKAFWSHGIPKFQVIADGKEVFNGRGIMLVGNISRYATGMRILKDASPCDGLLDVCIMPCTYKHDIIRFLLMTMVQMHSSIGELIYIKCKTMQVFPRGGSIITQIDGDPGPCMPLDIAIIPSAVRVLVPCP